LNLLRDRMLPHAVPAVAPHDIYSNPIDREFNSQSSARQPTEQKRDG
jgi:hypothetical protein